MASTRRKSAAIALAIVGVAGLSLAAAAQLNITSDTLGAGTTTVAACDTTAINVDYTVSGDTVTHVLLSNVADACAGDAFSVQLQATDTAPDPDVQVALGSPVIGTLTLTGTITDAKNASIPLGSGNSQLVEAITGIAIVIN